MFSGFHLCAFPRDTNPFVVALDMKGFAAVQQSLGIGGKHFIQRQAATFAIEVNQIALKALAAAFKGDDQSVMVLLQHAQAGADLQRCFEHFRRLRTIILGKGAGHATDISQKAKAP